MDNIIVACVVAGIALVASFIFFIVTQSDNARLRVRVEILERQMNISYLKIDGLTKTIDEMTEIGSDTIDILYDHINNESK